MRLDRILSLVVCLIYVGIACGLYVSQTHKVNAKDAFIAMGSFLFFLIWPLVFIWFGDEIGEISGAYTPWGYQNRMQPGWLVKFCGWALLVAPLCCGGLGALGVLDRFRAWLLGD